MKLDLDLVRQILLTLEEALHPADVGLKLNRKDIDPHVLAEHVRLMQEADFVSATMPVPLTRTTLPEVVVHRIKWKGYEFLDASRSEGIWEKTKETMETTGTWGLGVAISTAVMIAQETIKKKLGL